MIFCVEIYMVDKSNLIFNVFEAHDLNYMKVRKLIEKMLQYNKNREIKKEKHLQ